MFDRSKLVTACAVLALALSGSFSGQAQTPPENGNAAPAGQGTAAKPSASVGAEGVGATGKQSGTVGVQKTVTASDTTEPEHAEIKRQNWTFAGMNGYFDQQQLRRGYKVYKTVCANCHNMRLMSFRNLGQPGGPEFPKDVVEQIAAETQVPDPTKGEGEMRPGRPSDRFQWIYKNEKEAAAAIGAVPPDLSLMAKARTVERETAFYASPFVMLKDIATQYQEQGSDYIYALLNGYKEPPADKKIADGLNYNVIYPGNQIAMKQPLEDGTVDYEDGTPNTLDQQSRDVVAYLSWAAEPHLMERKRFGLWVLGYLAVVAVLLFLSKQALWRGHDHS